MPFSDYFKAIHTEVDATLDRLIPGDETYPPSIHQSMRYSLFAGGKRLRPMLAVAASDAVGGSRTPVLCFAAALEMIHTYTLIHDDLPALDDDDIRRGQMTNHMKFGESTAILAGDGLLTMAFEILTDTAFFPGVAVTTILAVANETASAIGSLGTIGGQVVDIEYESAVADLAVLEYIHTHKTGKLITASVRGGAILGDADDDQVSALTVYGKHVGLAFQIIDDILDIEGDWRKLGKTPGSDIKKEKMTYPSVVGMEAARKRATELTDSALEALEMFDDEADHLRDLAKYIAARTF